PTRRSSDLDLDDATDCEKKLDDEGIAYDETRIDTITVSANIVDAIESPPMNFQGNLEDTPMDVISAKDVPDIDDVPSDESILTGVSSALSEVISFKDEGDLTLFNEETDFKLHFHDPKERSSLQHIM